MTIIHLRRALFALAILVTSCVLAACGSSSSSSSSASSASSSGAGSSQASGGAAASGPGGRNRAALRACLQQHGVTLPARRPGAGPPAGGGGFFGGGGGGGAFQRNPKLAAALQACGGARAFGGGRRFRISRAAITKYAACVRQHGYNLPNPNLSGKGPVFPSGIRSDPKFLAASRSCQTLLFPRPGGGPPGSNPTS